MKKILNYVFLFCLSVLALTLAACGSKVKANELINSLLVEQDSYVDADFYVVGEMKSGEDIYEITWESDNACLSVSDTKNEAGYYTIFVNRPEDEAQTITLTATLIVSKNNTAQKDFEFRVYPIDVYDLLDNFAFEHKGVKVEMGSTIDLPVTTEYKGAVANITWESTNPEVTISTDYKKASFATVVIDTDIKLTATITYKGESTKITYNLTIAPFATDFEKLKEWYENDGITQILSGYVVELGEAYSESYQNISMYIINDDFTGGYYLYRVKMDANEASQLKVGAHVTATGTVNTNYSGLMDTSAGGNVVVDEEIEAINVAEKAYAIDNDLIANVKSLYYRTSTLVTLSNWKVKEVAETIDDGSSSAVTILTIEKDGVEHKIRYSNYVANTPMPNRNKGTKTDVYNAIEDILDT
ncbi:MAG: hypothetical protein J6R47_03640, partial [Acholeplasmatales bacterium]|nr:hypothetical protein [Acholeplasmatales bacterium]